MTENEFEFAGKLADFAQGDICATQVPGKAIGNVEGKLCAFTDFCTHEGVSFTGGYGVLFEDKVICMLHSSVFDAMTGKSLDGPAYDDLGIFEVKVEGEDVYISKAPRNNG